MTRRDLLGAVGVATASLGVVMVVAPGLAADVGRGRPIVVLVGLLAAVQGLRAWQARRSGPGLSAVETGDPETPPDLPAPGVRFDERLASLERYHPRTTSARRQVRERLTEAAVATLTRREQCSEAAAREMLREGTWTDDPVAAAFFAERGRRSLPLREQLASVVRGRRFDLDARRAVDAVVAVAEGEDA